MQINSELLKINGQVFSNLKNYQFQRNKLWLNSDRNMEGFFIYLTLLVKNVKICL